jgi:hypothetical protein
MSQYQYSLIFSTWKRLEDTFSGQLQKKKDIFKMSALKPLNIKLKMAKKLKLNMSITQQIQMRAANRMPSTATEGGPSSSCQSQCSEKTIYCGHGENASA